MQVELWYDAVACETDIALNGRAVEKNDIFGFLYPVRNYPLQTWLYPDSSWKGLESQLLEVAREEDIELIFHGRKADYEDVEKCIVQNKQIKTILVEWDVCSKYEALLMDLLERLKNNDVLVKKYLMALNRTADAENIFDFRMEALHIEDEIWSCHLYEDVDLIEADENRKKCCCYVHQGFFTSFDQLQKLQWLTRSLRMSADGIYCCFDNEKDKKDYSYYAQSFSGMRFHFYLESDDYFAEAKRKYGYPAVLRMQMEKTREILRGLCEFYKKLEDGVKEDFHNLAKRYAELNSEEKERYEKYKMLTYYLRVFAAGIEEVLAYMNILFSVSLDNKQKEEDKGICHYACIDKLSEKIASFLNA